MKMQNIGVIPLDQIPNMMRAVGFYPSDADLDNILNEVFLCIVFDWNSKLW
jgi:hypothetical protein